MRTILISNQTLNRYENPEFECGFDDMETTHYGSASRCTWLFGPDVLGDNFRNCIIPVDSNGRKI